MTQSKYNRGEWAELYVLAKILCEQSVTVRVHGSKGTGNSLDVQRVRRGSQDVAEEFLVDGDHIVCVHVGKRIPKDEVCRHVKPLLRAIKAGKVDVMNFHSVSPNFNVKIINTKTSSTISSETVLNILLSPPTDLTPRSC